MEVDYEELKSAVDGFRIRDYGEITSQGLTHILFLCKKERLPAEYFIKRTMVDGADIYMWRCIPKIFKKPILLHEVAEATYRYNEKFDEFSRMVGNSHDLARELDIRYAKETFNEEMFHRYLEYQEKLVAQFSKPVS